ncbi:hypothetical protein DGG96_20475 [Legionella qingyii]|uniref:Uncharacterized protein n=1 Tax=Legionella qingyii TaxID=2184757 RepID=A0A317TWR6_9GAMM|nr:hypothetical protein [Legionella qingyii]PWY53784.1 hypothetical protein DGG96_20475 [Legionella qingyii]RUR18304.1 hypothetical protein ELY20_16655 [Legionella qingyii]RUR21305.1 hypothetical protein ELY16_16220 [Legionella qingyii]
MLVQRILDFIETLEKESPLSPCDQKLRERLLEHFSKSNPTDTLNQDDFLFLLDCYKTRWAAIVDDDDYMLNPSAINLHWIDLARELGPLTKINYLKILIPTLTNEKDLNDFSSLNETVNLFNFYLGYGGNTLYRKLSFCKHLEKWQFELSTYRADKKLSIVTIDELARLKLCKQTEREVSVDTEIFKNFWDLMRKKVFVNLKARGRMPIALLPHLMELVERYYYLQTNKVEFSEFKKETEKFFHRLYEYQLVDVNFLYGSKIKYKENEEYLLDLFIALHTAKNYSDLDYEIQILGKWLFKYNPDLKATSKELEPIYHELSEEIEKREEPFINTHAFINCCKLVVSLFTTRFELSILVTRQTSSLWDKENTVFPEAYTILTVLLPLIAANKPKALETAYEGIIQDIILPVKMDTGWFPCFTGHKQTIKWFDIVQNCKYHELGVYWFEPERLFNALLLFNTSNESLKARINQFLDDIIQTYAQDENELMKQFRVNVLFTEFLNGLSEHHCTHLLRLIQLCDLDIAKFRFLSNCSKHINKQASRLCQGIESSSPCFFSMPQKGDKVKLFNFSDVKDVQSMIVDYKNQLYELTIDPKKLEKLSNYLFKIGQPILSVTQKENAKSCDRPVLDYIGQYT